MDAATKRQFKRFCAAKKLASAGIEAPAWQQALLDGSGTVKVERFAAPLPKDVTCPPLTLLVPTINGQPVLHYRPGHPYPRVVKFGAN